MVAVMRRFHPVFTTFWQMRRQIGRVYAIEARQSLNIERLDLGWRASRAQAGGGALLDLGYHLIDLFQWYFGLPSTVSARTGNAAREKQNYDVEDTAFVLFDYVKENISAVSGTIVVSRAFPEKSEMLRVLGTKGVIEINRKSIARITRDGIVQEKLERSETWPSATIDQLDYFCKAIDGESRSDLDYKRHFGHMALIEACYLSASERRIVEPITLLGKAGLSESQIDEIATVRF